MNAFGERKSILKSNGAGQLGKVIAPWCMVIGIMSGCSDPVRPTAHLPPPSEWELRVNAISKLHNEPPKPILADDLVKTSKDAIALAEKGCPYFHSGRISAELHADKWFVDWDPSWTSVDKRTGAVSECVDIQE